MLTRIENLFSTILEWPVRRILSREANAINRARIRILAYGLLLRILTTGIVIFLLVSNRSWMQMIRAGILEILIILFLLMLRAGMNWKKVAHFVLLLYTLFVYSNIFVYSQGLNLLTTQIVLLVIVYSFYILGRRWAFTYSVVNVLPVVFYMLLKEHVYIPVGPQRIDTASFIIILCHNFIFIIFAHYHFFRVFNRTIDKLNYSTEELTRYNQFQKRLIASITHDIKSPLKYLMITSESLSKDFGAGARLTESGLRAIHSSAFQMYHFTNNLLEYARVYTVDGAITRHEVNPHQLVNEKIEIFRDIASVHGTSLRNEIDPLMKISTSKPLLSVIVHNLLDNALKYTMKGHVLFSGHREGTGHVKLVIQDTGTGMDAAMLKWCNQSARTVNPNGSGGLGLTMVKELLGMIGASLHVSCPPSGGTRVVLGFTEPS